ncbi:ATP-binding protein [Pengzhenrongella frigida]|uniref:ATP-binding protein n=1 Tax=Pengzhenrongella frigida TaxID=1259133 RepID=UPI0013EB9736|nr:BTAD domain-containing putative transcriptional regulator [Cellulomonas sp. HLT2-17]
MQISTLGPLTIDGAAVEGSRLPALLPPLFLARGRIVSTADLIEAVWAGDPPADPTGALQALVTRARRLGLTVTATAGGYRLDPTDLEVDALLAQDLLSRARAALSGGDPRRASDHAARALALWADDDAPAVGPSGRLFTDLLTIRVEGELAAPVHSGLAAPVHGPDDVLLDHLRDAVRHRPTDEPLTALLMRALAARGRDAEAIATYERLRLALAETYGTDPSAVVARTHLALLRGELAAPADAATPPAAPSAPDRSGSAHRSGTAAVRPRGAPGWRRATASMVGREADVSAVEHALLEHPLVTVVAVGGAGKTRLAVEVARRATERGAVVCAVELAGVRDPAEVLPTLLSALGASESAADTEDLRGRRVLDPGEQILRAVATFDGLIVLDNCEHLLAGVAEVTAALLAAAGPGLRILATSRAPLGILGEAVHPVLALPDGAALALLETRARAARPTLEWDTATALELCHRLDNLPLALELAAARLRSMPLADVLAGVADRFALLDHALRGLPDRHQGLWSMVDWSWDLLDPTARALLRDLAVVPAPFTADLATEVGGLEHLGSRAARLALLGQLVEQSLLSLEESGDGRPARYRMLETVREYGEARLAADGARDVAMERLAGWAAGEARRLRSDFVGERQLAALRATTEDHDTLVLALRWSVDGSHEREAFAIAAALFTVWTIRGLHVEAITWARQLLRVQDPVGRRAGWELLCADDGALPLGDQGRRRAARPDPDDVAATATMAILNAGIANANDQRVSMLAVRLTRWAVSAHLDSLSPRTAALARMSAVFTSGDHAVHLAAAGALVDERDLYLHAVGLFLRAALRENHGDVRESGVDARDSYSSFEAVGDHWGMGMAAQAIGQWGSGRATGPSDDWLTRAVHHLELVGAVQDTQTIRVVRDVHRALDGSAVAAADLAATAQSPSASSQERANALIGLGLLAAKHGRWPEAVERGDAAVRVARSETTSAPQGRIVTEVAAAILRIRAGRDDAGGLLAVAARGAFDAGDMPVLGAVALAYSELAAATGDTARSDELWVLGRRLGANLALLFGPQPRTDPDAADVDDDPRMAQVTQAWTISVADTVARLATLIDSGR